MWYLLQQEAGIIFVSWNKWKLSDSYIKKSALQIKTSFTPHQNTIALLFSLDTLIYCFRWEDKFFFLKFLVLLVTKKRLLNEKLLIFLLNIILENTF